MSQWNVPLISSEQNCVHIFYLHLPGGKGRPARKADNLTAIYEPIV
jgi:hypothetical protein